MGGYECVYCFWGMMMMMMMGVDQSVECWAGEIAVLGESLPL
jgi:hypothetical protein